MWAKLVRLYLLTFKGPLGVCLWLATGHLVHDTFIHVLKTCIGYLFHGSSSANQKYKIRKHVFYMIFSPRVCGSLLLFEAMGGNSQHQIPVPFLTDPCLYQHDQSISINPLPTLQIGMSSPPPGEAKALLLVEVLTGVSRYLSGRDFKSGGRWGWFLWEGANGWPWYV